MQVGRRNGNDEDGGVAECVLEARRRGGSGGASLSGLLFAREESAGAHALGDVLAVRALGVDLIRDGRAPGPDAERRDGGEGTQRENVGHGGPERASTEDADALSQRALRRGRWRTWLCCCFFVGVVSMLPTF